MLKFLNKGKNGEKMTNEESNKTENTKEQIEKSGQTFSDKASDVFDNLTDEAKKMGEKAGDAFEDLSESAKKAGTKAGEVIGDLAEGTKKATEKAGDKASDVVGSILTGMKKVGDKATDAVEILEIKREISKLEDANKKLVPQISDTVLTLYAEKKIKEPSLVEFCQQFEVNNKLISDKKAQIETIKKSETE